MYRAGDSSAIHTALSLDRCWRDITTAATHVAVRNRAFRVGGQLALGLDVDRASAFGL
jgi:hypothetical protein